MPALCRHVRRLIAAALVGLAGVGGAHALEACPRDVVICCDAPGPRAGVAPQRPGLGMHVWPSNMLQDAQARERLAALKPAQLRFSLGPNWRRQPALRAAMSDAELDAAVAAGFSVDGAGDRQIAIMRRIGDETGAMHHLIIWDPPPLPGDPDFTAAGAPPWRRMRADPVGLAARFYVALLRHIGDRGLSIGAVELSNEPDGGWNIKIAPPTYLALVRAVRAEAARRGVALPKIYGPGTSQVRQARAYFADDAIGRGILGAVDVVSLHGWDDSHDVDRFAELEALKADFARLGAAPPIAFTEFGVARPDLDDRSEPMNARKRRPDSIAYSDFYGAVTTRDIVRLFGAGVGTVIYWEFQDQPWGRGSLGLVDSGGRAKPVYDTVRTLAERLSVTRPARIDAHDGGRIGVLAGERGAEMLLSNPTGSDYVVASKQPVGPGTTLATCAAPDGRQGVRVGPQRVSRVPIAGGSSIRSGEARQ